MEWEKTENYGIIERKDLLVNFERVNMRKIVINGGRPLQGEITISGAKK